MWRALVLIVWAACGRINFDPRANDAGMTGDAGDAGDAGVAETGLLLHFAFESDGLQHDRSPGQHDATCNACPAVVAGRSGLGAASFDGSTCLRIADAADLRPAAFTFAAWMQPAALQAVPGSAFGRSFNGATAGTNTIELFVDANDLWKVAVNTTSRSTMLDHGVWHHVAGVFDGNALTMYVDGAPQGAPLVIGPATYSNDDLHIGCDFNNGAESNNFIGNVDELRLYDHPLSAAEVAALPAR